MRDKRKPSILANVPSPSVTDPRFKERGSILSRGNRKRTRLDEYACIKGELTKHLQMLSGGDSRNNNFNLLRFLFATGVIFGHSFDFVDNSTPAFFSFLLTGPGAIHVLSVDGFFLLSGFLITQSWLQCPVLGTFLTKRILMDLSGVRRGLGNIRFYRRAARSESVLILQRTEHPALFHKGFLSPHARVDVGQRFSLDD